MRANARNWLELADKVWHYRRDQLSDADARELRARIEGLRQQVAAREEAAKLKLGIEALEPVLQRLGGKVYPKTSLVENVEFFLIAAIVIIGIRTYFVQPFKIPTNSMWPSYYGMTPQVFPDPADHPGPLMQALRFVTLGARNHTLTALASGPIEAESVNGAIHGTGLGGDVRLSTVNGAIDASFAAIAPQQKLSFNTVNGSITVGLPKDAGVKLQGSVVNGRINCDFPLELGQHASGRNLSGTIGDGRATLRAETVNGSIAIQER